MVWRDVFLVTAMSTGALAVNAPSVIGTCIETLDDDGVYLRSGVKIEGNYAICHWMYVLSQAGINGVTTPPGANTTSNSLGGSPGTNWGETRYLNEYDWGTHGSALLGTNIQSKGTAIAASYGFALSHTNLNSFIPGAVYQMSWYQPKY